MKTEGRGMLATAALAMVVVQSGCVREAQRIEVPYSDPALVAAVSNLTARLAGAEDHVTKLEVSGLQDTLDIEGLKQRLIDLEAENKTMRGGNKVVSGVVTGILQLLPATSATLDPDDHGYSLVSASGFVFAIKTESAGTYLDGYVVKFQIGNTSSADIRSVSITFTPPETKPVDATMARLPAGSWTKGEVILPSISVDQLRKTKIEINGVKSLSLTPPL